MRRLLKHLVLALVATLALAACSSGTSSRTSTPQASAKPAAVASGRAVVIIHNFAFHPATLTVKPGTTVTWINKDPVAHTSTAYDHLWNSGLISPGKSYSFTFATANTYTYYCEIHQFMHGVVKVL